jgi:hypothetical protein
MNRQEAIVVLQEFNDTFKQVPVHGHLAEVNQAITTLVDSLTGPLSPAQFNAFQWAAAVLDDELSYSPPFGDAGSDAVLYEIKQLIRQLASRVTATLDQLDDEELDDMVDASLDDLDSLL